MRRRAQRNCKIAILLVLCIAGFFQFVSNGNGGSRGGSDQPGPGRHGHPPRPRGHLRKPKRVSSNGTVFVPDKELAGLAQLQGWRPKWSLTLLEIERCLCNSIRCMIIFVDSRNLHGDQGGLGSGSGTLSHGVPEGGRLLIFATKLPIRMVEHPK